MVRQNWKFKPAYATSGSCALVGVIQGSVLYVAGVGDSRAVLATSEESPEGKGRGQVGEGGEGGGPVGRLIAVELSEEHSASSAESRQEVLDRCPEDPGILVEKKGTWRVKGFIEVSA